MEVPVIVDGRNLLDPVEARAAGFEYVAMGREAAHSLDFRYVSADREHRGPQL